jgi:hypothetical protein
VHWSIPAALRFAAGGVLAFAAAYALSEAADPVYPEMRARMALWRVRAPHVDAVVVGNSHASTLELSELGMAGMYFSMAGQDAFEGAYLARHAARAPRVRYVLFGASYGVQRKDHAVVGDTDLRARRRQLYARTPWSPLEGERELWLAGKLAPVVRDDHWKGVIGRPIRKRAPVVLAEDGRRVARRRAVPLGREELALYGAKAAAQHRALGVETMEHAPETPARVEAALGSLARELRERDVLLVLYTPPYHASYLAGQDPAVVAEARAILRRIEAENPNAVWMDYSADGRFREQDALFNNSDHLNPDGGRIFSLLLRDCLRARLAGMAETDEAACPAGPRE